MMSRPTLRRPSNDAAVKELQMLLNRIGALLTVDGDFGPATERAVKFSQKQAAPAVNGVVNDETWSWLETQPEPSAELPTEVVTFIVKEEIGSRAFYDRHAAFPHFPGGASGVTIGIGYDLRFQTLNNFERDWGNELSAEHIELLKPYLGKRGSKAAVDSLRAVKIPYPSAWRVFVRVLLPRFINQTREAFPGYDGLPSLCRGALVSLVYNRGPSMNGDRRIEIRAIRDHIAARELDRVESEFRAMKRLWPNSAGLRKRRDKEADLWKRGLNAAG